MGYALKNPTGPASEAAFAFAVKLSREAVTAPADLLTILGELAKMNAQQVSDRIDVLKLQIKLNQTKATVASANALMDKIAKQPVAGWYLVDGTKYQVKISKATGVAYLLHEGTGYMGAKGHAEPILAKIAESGMDLAIAYGKATGTCGICSKTLTDPKSIAAGIGPVCAKKF